MSLEAWGDEPWEPSEAVALTEQLLRQPKPFTKGLVVNRPARNHSHAGRLFQAAMGREYAMTWHGRKTRTGVDQRWCEKIGQWSYSDCLRLVRVNLYLARRLRRTDQEQNQDE